MNYYFTGKDLLPLWFSSLELPFGKFYKAQIAPFITHTLTSVWPWGSYNSNFVFTFAEPYYEEHFDDFGTDTMRFFFKYTNDNNPFNEATVTPLTVVDGLSKIGGYFALFGILKLCLFIYNKGSFESSLKKRYKQIIEDHREGKQIMPESF